MCRKYTFIRELHITGLYSVSCNAHKGSLYEVNGSFDIVLLLIKMLV